MELRYPSKTDLKPKSRETSLAHNVLLSHPIVLTVCTVPCSEQNFKMIGQLKGLLGTNGSSRDFKFSVSPDILTLYRTATGTVTENSILIRIVFLVFITLHEDTYALIVILIACRTPIKKYFREKYDGVMTRDVMKWKHFPRYWPFVWGIHRSPVNSPHKGQWRGALMFSLNCAWTVR